VLVYLKIWSYDFLGGTISDYMRAFAKFIMEGILMRKKRFVWFFFPLFCLAISGCSRMGDVQPADLVIENAKVVTIDKDNPRAEAIAFKGEKIVAVTTNKKIKSYIDEGTTTVIDAKGRLVVPGLNDAHAHFGGIDPDYIDFRYITDPKIITEKVSEKVAQAKPGQLIRGGRWEHEMFLDKQWPTKELIDPVSPDNPVALSRADGHSILVNSYVLKRSGISKDTPNPSGGEIQKDPVTGEPTGIIKELARRLLKYGAVEIERTPEEEEAQRLREWQAALDMANSGIKVYLVERSPAIGGKMAQLDKTFPTNDCASLCRTEAGRAH